MQSITTTRRAEQIREETGIAWELACIKAERERDAKSYLDLHGPVVYTDTARDVCGVHPIITR